MVVKPSSQPPRPVPQGKALSREKLSLRLMITLLITFGTLVGIGVSIALFVERFYQEKLRDSWSIIYLEMEQKADDLQSNMRFMLEDRVRSRQIQGFKADGMYRLQGNELVAQKAGLPDAVSQEMFPSGVQKLEPLNLVQLEGRNYFARARVESDATLIDLWRAPIRLYMQQLLRFNKTSLVYAANTSGDLIYSSSPEVTNATLAQRRLVEMFSQRPLTSGQIALAQGAKKGRGFYHLIPESNVVLFAEVEEDAVLNNVHKTLRLLIGLSLLVALVVIVLIQFPLDRLVEPLSSLARVAMRVGQGDFAVPVERSSFGELVVLSDNVRGMMEGLRERDVRIKEYIEVEKENARREQELEVASRIQHGLIGPSFFLTPSGSEMKTHYVPCSEVAGDWFDAIYDERTGEFLTVLADVTGHGVGSGMITAAIAATFRRLRFSGLDELEILSVFQEINVVLNDIGSMYATAAGMHYKPALGKLEYVSAGHPSGFVVDRATKKVKSIRLPSSPLGHKADTVYRKKTIDFGPDHMLMVYSDGLLEAQNSKGREFGSNMLKKTIAKYAHLESSEQLLKSVLKEWETFVGGVPLDDDVCVMAVRGGALGIDKKEKTT